MRKNNLKIEIQACGCQKFKTRLNDGIIELVSSS